MNNEQQKLIARIIISAFILVFFSIFKIFYNFSDGFKFLIFLIAYFIVGLDVVFKTLKNIFKLKFLDEKSLMFIATVGAFFLKQYFEAVVVFLLYQIGEVFQNVAVSRSKNQISCALHIRPLYANLKTKNSLKKVFPSDIRIGDVIVVKPGERIPLDGVVLSGGSFLDASSMTGESEFLSVGPKDRVLSGVLNVSGVLEIVVEKKYEDSTVKKVLDLIESVSEKKSKTENLIQKFAKIYTPCVVFSAVLIFLIPVFLFKGFWKIWLERCLIFLVISCPCALVISVPVSFFLAISKAAKNGILVKGSIFLERMSKIKTIVFDKTGTLTKGEFVVTKIVCFNLTKSELLEIVSLAESKLNHPIAKSIRKFYAKSLDLNRVTFVEEVFGKGVRAVVDGKKVVVGNLKLMNDIGIFLSDREIVGTNVYVAVDGTYEGFVSLKDCLKENVKDDLQNLKKNHVEKLVMLTGDKKIVGEKIAQTLCLDDFYCELLPYEKVEKLERYIDEQQRNEEGVVVFVGDGVNDAASLKRADVGVAMGAVGSDAAMEACDVVLMDDDLSKLTTAILISKKVVRTVKQNVLFSLFFKAIIFIFGAFGLTNIWLAIFSDVGVSILAILNSFRAFRIKN